MVFRKSLLPILSLLLILFGSCNSGRFALFGNRPPDWVRQRPANSNYYIGIGYADKKSNPMDYPGVAKGNALEEMSREIKVTISTQSVISQNQYNQNFNQQYLSSTQMLSSGKLEGYEIAGAWEDRNQFWIYYRLNKAEYELQQKKKREVASEKAIDLLNRAANLDLSRNFGQAFQLRVRAANALQDYLNDPMEVYVEGRKVFLLNEIFSQLQDQLLRLQIHLENDEAQVVSGKAPTSPIRAKVQIQIDSLCEPVAFLPLRLEFSDEIKFSGNAISKTQVNGNVQFQTGPVQGKASLNLIQVKPDLMQLIGGDSLSPALLQMITQLSVPVNTFRLRIEPIRIFLVSNERNIDRILPYLILEPLLKNALAQMGCLFVQNPDQSDYRIDLAANTRDLGYIWGKMLKSGIQMSLVVSDSRNQSEIYKDAIDNLFGYQLTPEKAGLDAYNTMEKVMQEKTLPVLSQKLFSGK